ncbi:MAG: DUF5681 domain-containing protein [Sphingomicrobium sp.]
MSNPTNHGQSSGKDNEDAAKAYKVGKGKPPLHTQFKKGNKAAKGRPKGSKNIKTIVNEVLGSKVRAKINGKPVTITNTQYVMMQLASQARAGQFKAMDKVIALEERYGPQEDPAGPAPEEIERDVETLRDFLRVHDMFAAGNSEAGDD